VSQTYGFLWTIFKVSFTKPRRSSKLVLNQWKKLAGSGNYSLKDYENNAVDIIPPPSFQDISPARQPRAGPSIGPALMLRTTALDLREFFGAGPYFC